MKTVKISNKAADCLAWFADHPYYGEGDISEAIIALTEEWFMRDTRNKPLERMKGELKGQYKRFIAK